MRFHLPALKAQPVRRDNSSCAYTQKIRRFAEMMIARGHEVIIYGEGPSDVTATEYVDCYPEWAGGVTWSHEDWKETNLIVAAEVQRRKEVGDFLCLIAGCQQQIAKNHEDLKVVEFGIGYSGTFAPFRVFESYAWMHCVYATQAGLAGREVMNENLNAMGAGFDCVIPNYFSVDEFPFEAKKDDYFLTLSRVNILKGIEVAEDAAERLGAKLIIAGGEGDYEPRYGEVIGPVGPEQRGELISKAKAVFVPSLYLEPFGGIAVEAMLCGTPPITTDWGAFTETVQHGITGYRCRTLGEFVWAAEHAGDLDPEILRRYAVANFSTEAIAPRYETYFEQLQQLPEGWYSPWAGIEKVHRYGQVIPALGAKADLH